MRKKSNQIKRWRGKGGLDVIAHVEDHVSCTYVGIEASMAQLSCIYADEAEILLANLKKALGHIGRNATGGS